MLTAFQEKPGARMGSGEIYPMFQPLSVARMIWKRKLAIAGIAAAGCAFTVFAVRRMPSIYVSDALVLIDSQKIPEKFVSSTVSTDLQDRLATISQEVLSSAKLEKIISDFDLYKEERKSLFTGEVLELMRKDISIQTDRSWSGAKPAAFRVSYQGKNPRVVAQVANRIANLYIEENFKTREGQAEGTSEFMDRQLAEAKERLSEQEAAVGRFKLKYNGELPEQQGALISELGRLEVELQTNRDALSRAQESKAMLESNLAATETSFQALESSADHLEGPAAPAVAPAAELAPAQKSSALLAEQLNTLLARYGPAYPDVKRLEAQLDEAKAAEAAQPKADPIIPSPERRLAGSEPAAPTPRRALRNTQAADQKARASEHLSSLQGQIAIAQREIEFRTQEQARITAEMKQYSDRISRLPLHEQEMAQITRDYDTSKANYRNLLDKKLAAEMATDLEHGQKSERFTLLDPARVPDKPQRPKRPLYYAMGGLLSVLAGFGAGLGMEIQQGKLLGRWELGPGIPVLARLPRIVVARAAGGL
jgi:polysaccharide biosynthesis transport protein